MEITPSDAMRNVMRGFFAHVIYTSPLPRSAVTLGHALLVSLHIVTQLREPPYSAPAFWHPINCNMIRKCEDLVEALAQTRHLSPELEYQLRLLFKPERIDGDHERPEWTSAFIQQWADITPFKQTSYLHEWGTYPAFIRSYQPAEGLSPGHPFPKDVKLLQAAASHMPFVLARYQRIDAGD